MDNRRCTVALREVADVLAAHGLELCAPQVETHDGTVTVTLVIARGTLDVLALQHELEYLQGLGQVRAFAQQYHIEPASLEALLPPAAPTGE